MTQAFITKWFTALCCILGQEGKDYLLLDSNTTTWTNWLWEIRN